MSNEFTADQKKAVTHEGHDVLVSASAGSGKTSVLVERVVQKIFHDTNIDELLIVTFTEAAAREMKERIEKALQKAISLASGNEQGRLLNELNNLSSADISTIDSFCLKVIRRFYYVIGIDPGFRLLADEAERTLLKQQVWEQLRDDLYSEDPDFGAVVQNFGTDRSDEKLTSLIIDLFDYSRSKPDPNAWLDSLVEPYEVKDSLSNSKLYQQDFLPILQQNLNSWLKSLTSASQALEKKPDLEKISLKNFKDPIETLEDVSQNAEKSGFNYVRSKLSTLNFGSLRPPKDLSTSDEALFERAKSKRNAVKDSINKFVNQFLFLNDEKNTEIINESLSLVREIIKVVKQFGIEFSSEKRRRQLVDFNDLEHFALEILSGTSSESKQARAHYQNAYQEVLVDEYQDVNQLQEAILKQITKTNPGNMFMVGDVKQSIYGFRLAEPKLFLNKYNRFDLEDDRKEDAGEKIILAENFRSVNNVLYFNNLVFEQLMDPELGEIAYDDAAKLQYGSRDYHQDKDEAVELLIDLTGKKQDRKEDDPEKDEQQVMMVAQKIKEMIESHHQVFDRHLNDFRDIKFSDIALLEQSRGQNLDIQTIFSQLGIPVTMNNAQNFFQTTEIQVMLSYLQLIDNPNQDIPLVSVLRSPIVQMNENELALVRINDKTADYFQAVNNYVDNFGTQKNQTKISVEVYKKLSLFLEQLNHFRNFAHQNKIADLIWTIYQETGFLDYSGGMPNGAQRQSNLHALYNRANDYENNGFKGLFQFIQFINTLQANDNDLSQASLSSSADAVQVMTIHGSKGLQYPVVFLMNATKRQNTESMKGSALKDSNAGLGISYVDPKSGLESATLPKLIVKEKILQKNYAELMRVLYVAMTRAEQKLFVVGSFESEDDLKKVWATAIDNEEMVLDLDARKNAPTFMNWIIYSLSRHPNNPFSNEIHSDSQLLNNDQTDFTMSIVNKEDLSAIKFNNVQLGTAEWLERVNDSGSKIQLTENFADQISDRLSDNYPHKQATKTTAYQAVSELQKQFADPDIVEAQPIFLDNSTVTKKPVNRFVKQDFGTPSFLQKEKNPSSTDIGTATHLVFQKIDLTQPLSGDSVQKLIDELVSEKIISPEIAQKIDQHAILAFFDTKLGKLICENPTRVHREVPFAMLIDADYVFDWGTISKTDDDQVLIHGMIDGYLDLDDMVYLFDYKTDHITKNHGVEDIVSRYSSQLNLYGRALSNMLHREITEKYLYTLSNQQLVKVSNRN